MRLQLQKHEKELPDLSFFPEPVWIKEGGDNPIKFGQKNKARIANYIDIADLSLLSFSQAKNGLQKALDSEDPWARYWGYIVCSSFGQKAKEFYEKAREAAAGDKENLVRTRAAEFLGLCKVDDPRPFIIAALRKSNDPIEAGLILNTVILLEDGHAGYKFDLSSLFKEKKWKAGGSPLQRRVEYLLQK